MENNPTDILERIFKSMNFSNPRSMSRELLYSDYNLVNNLLNPFGSQHVLTPFRSQHGGKCVNKKYTINYNDKHFDFYCEEEDDRSIYAIRSPSNEDCSVVLVDRTSKIGYLQNINNYEGCVTHGFIYPHGGTLLLRATLTLLIQYQDELGIKRVQLKDNSRKACYNNKTGAPRQPILLPTMYFLLYGNTWYGKYGFLPYHDGLNIPHDENIKKYRNNQKIIKNAHVGDVSIYKYIEDACYKNKININLQKIKEKIEVSKDQKLSDFLIEFLKDYDDRCYLFSQIYIKIYNELKMFDFYGSSFYYDLPKPRKIIEYLPYEWTDENGINIVLDSSSSRIFISPDAQKYISKIKTPIGNMIKLTGDIQINGLWKKIRKISIGRDQLTKLQNDGFVIGKYKKILSTTIYIKYNDKMVPTIINTGLTERGKIIPLLLNNDKLGNNIFESLTGDINKKLAYIKNKEEVYYKFKNTTVTFVVGDQEYIIKNVLAVLDPEKRQYKYPFVTQDLLNHLKYSVDMHLINKLWKI